MSFATSLCPTPEDYAEALERVQPLFGIVASPVRSAASVAELAAQVRDRVAGDRDAARELVTALEAHRDRLSLDDDADRLRTARAAADLMASLSGADDGDIVTTLAHANVPTSLEAMARSTARASDVCRELQGANWQLLDQVNRLGGEWATQASSIIDALQRDARADEYAVSLVEARRRAEREATDLLGKALGGRDEPQPPTPPTKPESGPPKVAAEPRARYQTAFGEPTGEVQATGEEVAALVEVLREHADELDSVTVKWKKRSP